MGQWSRDLLADTRLALRQIGRQPGFAAAALVTLALGLGAPTAIFAIVHAVLLRPLPYAEPDRLVRFRLESVSPRGPVGFDALDVSMAQAWAAGTATLEGIAIFNETARTLTTPEGPVRLTGLSATPNLFALLGSAPAAGRVFDARDTDVLQVVLSHGAWRRYFNADPAVVNTTITLDGSPHRVTGVMPERFQFPTPETDFWVPVPLAVGGNRGMLLPAIGRIARGTPPSAVEAEGQRLLGDEASGVNSRLVVRTMQEQLVGPIRRTLWLLMGAVSLVSVVATVNIALLLLTRGAARQREFAVRLALGAARGRLIRQVSVDGVVLSVVGGVAGLLLAAIVMSVLVGLAPAEVPRLHETSFDASVFGFAAALVLVAGIVFGVLSSGRVVAGDALRTLGGGPESRLVSLRAPRAGLNVLAAAELALAMVLLVGAVLLLRSFVSQVLIDPGFEARDRMAAQFTMPASRYPTPEARLAFVDQVLNAVRARPGVTAAAVTTAMPNRQPTGRFSYDPVGIDPFADPWSRPLAEVRMVSDGGASALGLTLLDGRDVSPEDVVSSEPAIVISDAFARVHFPGQRAVGRTLYSESGNVRVIGVVGDVRPSVAGLPQYDPGVYLPLRQRPDVFRQFATVTLVVHGRQADRMADELRRIVRDLDADMPLFNVRTLDAEVSRLVARPRFIASVVGLFAVVAFVMAALGVYGVIAYTTRQRTREVAIRLALGATRPQAVRGVVRDTITIVVAGTAAGAGLSLAFSRSLAGQLHEVTPGDPWSLALVLIVLVATAAVAAWIPARRAAAAAPLAALRED